MPRPSNRVPLLDYIRPTDKDGALLSAVMTSYAFDEDRSFLEKDFLPTLLGLGSVHDRGYAVPVAVERKLGDAHVALVCDPHTLVGGNRPSLRVDLRPTVTRIQHSKVTLIHRQRSIRLVVSSANLTHDGYRRHREVATILDFGPENGLDPAILVEAVQDWIRVFGPSLSKSTRVALERALEAAATWKPGGRIRPRVLWGGSDTPLFRQFLENWQDREPVQKLIVASPFWPEPGPSLTPFEAISQELERRGASLADAELLLITSADAPGAKGRPRFPFELVRALRERGFPIRKGVIVASRLDALAEEISEGFGESTRPLHAKLVVLRGPRTTLVLIGSANFTRKGFGAGLPPEAANIEACVALRLNSDEIDIASLLPPTAEDAAVDWSTCGEDSLAECDPADEDVELTWPQHIDRVEVALNRTDLLNGELRIHVREGWVPATEVRLLEQEAPILALSAEQAPEPQVRRQSLEEATLFQILVRRAVELAWDGHRIWVPIDIEESSRSVLPSVLGARPQEEDLLDYFHGRIAEEDLLLRLQERAKANSEDHRDANDDPNRALEIQSYVIREFVESLFGLEDSLRSATYSPRAFEQALLGDFSPVALAERVANAYLTRRRSPTAAAFQLIEILRLLQLGAFLPDGGGDGRFKQDLRDLVARAIRGVLSHVAELAGRSEFQAILKNREFHRYVKIAVGDSLASQILGRKVEQ